MKGKRPAKGLVTVVELIWYYRVGATSTPPARMWVEQASRWFPQALPQDSDGGKRVEAGAGSDGYEAFVASTADPSEPITDFSAAYPAVRGSFLGTRAAGFSSVRLTLFADALLDTFTRTTVQRFFIETAEALGCIAATAEVRGNVEWSGRRLWHSGDSDKAQYLAREGRWGGLPEHPVWWLWAGAEYQPFLQGDLPPLAVKCDTTRGLFLATSLDPRRPDTDTP